MELSAKRGLIAALLGAVSLLAPTVVAAHIVEIGGAAGAAARGSASSSVSPPIAVGAVKVAAVIGPGTVLEQVHRSGVRGPVEAYILRIDLADPAVRVGLLYPGVVAAVQPISAMAQHAGAFAAVNGDFFNIGAAGAPIGPVVSAGRLIKGPERGRMLVAGVGTDGIGRVGLVWLQGSVAFAGTRHVLSDLNDANRGPKPILDRDGIALLTPLWGAYPRAGAVRGLRSVTEVLVRGGRVARVRHRAGAGAIPRGSYVLLGAGSGGRALARLRVGQPVSVTYQQGTSARVAFRFAIGGKFQLLRAGAVEPSLPVSAGAPRTAAGFSADGRVLYLVVTPGPRSGVPGLDLPQLARFMRRLGIRDAVALDDGGSTTIVAKLGTHTGLTLLNRPTDGEERFVANGVGVFHQPRRATLTMVPWGSRGGG